MSEPRQKTHFVLILDKSGSMHHTQQSTIVGFNEQIQQARESAKDQDILLSVVTFNGDVFVHQWDENAENAAELTAEEYQPNGATAMLDAIGYSLSRLLEAGDYDDENTAFLITVISDGVTNKDVKYSWSSVNELISSCEAKDNWTFNFIGCDRNYMKNVAERVGLSSLRNVALYSNNDAASNTRAYGKIAAATSSYFGFRAGGMKKAEALYDYALENISEDATSKPAPAAPAAASPDLTHFATNHTFGTMNLGGGCCRGAVAAASATTDSCCQSEKKVENKVFALNELANKYGAAKTAAYHGKVERVVW